MAMALFVMPRCDPPFGYISIFNDGTWLYEDEEVLREAGIMILNEGWYFIGVSWHDEYGPYHTEKQCKVAYEKWRMSDE